MRDIGTSCPLNNDPGIKAWCRTDHTLKNIEQIQPYRRICLKINDAISWINSNGIPMPEWLASMSGNIRAEKSIKVTPETESDRTNTKKLRRNLLDPAINKAIENAGNTIPADVWLALKELALSEEKPFSGIIGGKGFEYTSDNDEKKYLSKDALRKRLKRRITGV